MEFSRTRRNIWAEFSIFGNYIKDGDRVLDIGCGNGRLLNIFSDKLIEYTGVDNAENQIKEAELNYPGRRFLLADARNLPFPAKVFDNVFLVAILHNVPSVEFRRKVLREARRVLKDNGFLFLTVWDPWRLEAIRLIFKYSFLKLTGESKMDWGDVLVPWANRTERYYHFFTQRGILKLVRGAGFQIIKNGVAKNETGRRSNFYIVAQKV